MKYHLPICIALMWLLSGWLAPKSLLAQGPSCETVGFANITSPNPYLCTDAPIQLKANSFTGTTPVVDGFITPAFGVTITTDENSAQENWLEIYDGPSATGTRVAYWGPINLGGNYLGPLPNSSTFTGFGEFFDPNGFYSVEWCDANGTGSFDYTVTDYSDGSTMFSGNFNHLFQNCFIANVGAPQGTATFSGPGVTDFGNGFGEFDPSGLPTGTYDITYTWDDGSGCQGSSTQTVDVFCQCPTVEYEDIATNSPYDCDSGLIPLIADNSTVAGGFITPGFTITFQTDVVALLQNTLELFDGPNGTGNSLGFYPIGTIPPNADFSVSAEYLQSGNIYSFVWCDNQNDGIFTYEVVDHGSGAVVSSGAILGFNGCTTITFGPLTGNATFTGPGVTNLGNGTGFIDPAVAGNGMHTYTYEWVGTNCSGTYTQDIEITGCEDFSCIADAGSFSTPNGLLICYGQEFVIQTNWDFDGAFETGDFDDIPLADGALGGTPDGIADADGDNVNGVIFGLYNDPPSAYIGNDIDNNNLVTFLGSAPEGALGDGRILNNIGGNTQFWVTNSYAFDEDLDGSGNVVIGFDDQGDGSVNCFNTNVAGAVQVTFLDDIFGEVTQVCDPNGFGVDLSIRISGGLPGFDNSQFIVFGPGPGMFVNNNESLTFEDLPFGSPFAISVNDFSGCQKVFTGNTILPGPSDGFDVCPGIAGAINPTFTPTTYSFNNHCFPADNGSAPLPLEYMTTCFDQTDEINDHPIYFTIQLNPAGGGALKIDFNNIDMINGDDLQAALFGPINNCPIPGSYPPLIECYEGNQAVSWNLNGLQQAGTYLLVMDSRGDDTGTWTVDVNVPPVITVCPTAFLQGSFNPGTTGPEDRQRVTLAERGLIPPQQPYDAFPWNYNGDEQFANLDAIPADMVDWVLVNIRDGADPSVLLSRAAGVLHADGTITDINGNNIPFGVNSLSGVYLEVEHRSHLPITSSTPLFPNGEGEVCYDFTSGLSQAFLNINQNDQPMMEVTTLSGPYYTMITGNTQALDCQIDINDLNMLFFDYNLNPYYGNADLNMDGLVDANDVFLMFASFESNCHQPY